jgi:hypothetical protein
MTNEQIIARARADLEASLLKPGLTEKQKENMKAKALKEEVSRQIKVK